MDIHRPSGNGALGFGFAMTTVVLWGVLPLALKVVLTVLDALTITGFRLAFAALVLGVVLWRRDALPPLAKLGRNVWGLLAIATLGLAANYISYLVGLDWTTPANAQVLIQLAPLLLALGGILVLGERFTPAQWAGFAVLVAGLALFSGSQLRALAATLDTYVAGVGMMVLAALTWAAYGLAQKQLLRDLPSQAVMLCIYVGCSVCFAPFVRPAGLMELDAVGWGVLIFCAANTLVADGAFAAALEHWEASRVSAVLSLTPLATLGFAGLAFWLLPGWLPSEELSPASLAGAALVVVGSLVTSLGGRE
jgi:drug/metabolite transporter (DMT)-like permease